MKAGFGLLLWVAVCTSLVVLTACQESKPRVKAMSEKGETPKAALASFSQEQNHSAEDVVFTTPTTITAPDYEVTLYGAFAFAPDRNEAGLISADSGQRFVVLDIAVENTSKAKTVDMGQILLSAKVTDDEGNLYPRNALALEAFELEYPEATHKSEYSAMKGKIKPGGYFRTSAYGFQAPEGKKNFVLSLPENSNVLAKPKLQEAWFSVE